MDRFVSAASGMAMLAVLFKSVTRSESVLVGNFYRFFLLSATRILLPLALVMAVFLLANGTPATLAGAGQVITLQGDTVSVARGPVAAIVAIKQLGTNGGGFFGTNSAHPFENPTFLSNYSSPLCNQLGSILAHTCTKCTVDPPKSCHHSLKEA